MTLAVRCLNILPLGSAFHQQLDIISLKRVGEKSEFYVGDVHYFYARWCPFQRRTDVFFGIPHPSAIVYDGGEGHFGFNQGKSNIDANHFIFGRNLLAATPTVEVAAQVEIFPISPCLLLQPITNSTESLSLYRKFLNIQ